MFYSWLNKFIIAIIFGTLTLVSSRLTMAQPLAVEAPELSLEQKVGQVFIFGYPGVELTPFATKLLAKIQPGGLLAFGRHIKSLSQIGKLNQDLQKFSMKTSKVPFLLMVDQEGGTVSRIHLSSPLPSALALGRVRKDDLIEKYGHFTGQLLLALGFQMNLAPVLDLSDPTTPTFIGNRSFGPNASEVSRITNLYSRGLAAAGVIPTAKHFPGHGGVEQDSHKEVPRKLSSIEELTASDLLPFKRFQQIPFAKAVMLGHVALPNADPSSLPAAFSPYILRDVLRTQVGFTGLAITDDVEMGAADVAGDLGERAVKAFEAGNDMIMVAGSFKSQWAAYSSLLKAVKSGRVSEERLEESVQRILTAKSYVKPFNFSIPKAIVSARNLAAAGNQVLADNFQIATLATPELQGTYDQRQHYLIFSSDARFFSAFKTHIPKRTSHVRLTPQTLAKVPAILRKFPTSVAIYYASGSQTARWLQKISEEDKKRLIVINTNHSAAVSEQEKFLSVLNINSPAPESGAWLADFLSFKKVERAEASTFEN